VADVQTKRMLRRTGSTSSIGSSKAGSARGPPGSQLERRGSSGSMSERTFRDPSPSRSQPVPSAADAPPVPSIPKNMQQTAVPANSHRRATSLEAAAMRVASPPQNKASGRGSSLGPTGPAQSPRRAGQKMPSMSSLQELTGVERPSSRGSVNFSLPTSSRPASSVGQRQLTFPSPQRANPPRITSPTNQNLVYDPHTRSFLPEAEILAIEQRLWDVANKPVKKKKRIAQNQATGTHLASGTIGGRPRGMAVDAMEAAKTQPPKYVESAVSAPVTAPLQAVQPVLAPERQPTPAITQTTTTPKKKTKKIVPQRSGLGIKVVSDSDSDQASYAPNSSDNESDVGSRPTIFNTRAGSMLAKKPSIVREDREREEEEDETPKSASPPVGMNKLDTSPVGARTISPSPLLQATAGRGHGRGQASASAAFAEERQHTRSASQPAPIIQDPAATMLTLAGKGSIRGGRVQSVSPPRTTHFATTPDNLVVRHQPPPRSVSPRKSALKHSNSSNSPRGPSPVCDIPGARGVDQAMSEASNDSTVNSEDQLKPRKKSVRVSFDETNVVVGEAAAQLSTDSPMVASPQTNRPWFSIGRGKQKDVAGVEDDDEVMKPRPALPSFGSVRERKPSRELEERQLVKPAEPVETKPAEALPPPPLFTTPTGEVFEYSLGQSNDDVVGAILSQDAASKNEANISKSREPLPPQVTSVEGSGYNSDSDSSAYSDENRKSDVAVVRAESLKHGPEGGHADTYRALASPPPPEPEPEEVENRTSSGGLSEIAIPQATPTLEGTSSRRQWSNVPGSWDNSTSESSSQEQEENDTLTATPTLVLVEHHATESTLATIRISEPTPEIYPLGLPTLGLIAAENSHPTTAIMEDTEESDANDSIYSDAAEDLLDFEGDGFMSLDAVVDNLVVNSTEPGLAITTPDSPTTKETKERAYRKSQLSRKSSEPDLDEGWGKAQEYWKGLSAEKKRQLEEEAREEVEGSDTEVEVKPTPKPKKKQKAAIKPSAIEVPARNQPAPRQDRSYMIAPGTKADPDGHTQVMRSSMRPGPSDSTSEPHIRKSMRGSGSMRHSLRASSETVEPRGSLQKKYRPMFYRPVEVKADPLAVNRHVRNLSAASAAAAAGAAKKDIIPPAPVLRRQSSGDSDSSFKRARPSNQGSNFRRSMRSLEQSTGGRQQSPIRSSRFSLRSLSPTGSSSRQPFSRSSGSGAPPVGSPQTQMRSSMRSSYDSAPSLRGANSSKRGKSPLRIPGFGRSSSKQSPTVRQRPQRSSRFADSSDEDEDRPVFRSRFVDSTDEDEPLPARSNMRGTMRSNQPVRSIPRRAGVEDGDSSDLPDSDDEKSPPLYSPGLGKLGKKRTGMNGTAATTSAQGVTLASGPLQRSGSGRGAISSPATTTVTSGLATRQNNSRRGSFMSILRRKKPDPSSKVRKSDAESPARRDTPLERSKSDLQAVKRQDSGGRPMSPRLQKRNPLSMENSETWPLPVPDNPPRILSEEDGRPFTADGGDGVVVNEVNGNGKGDGIERPDLGTRRFTATGVGAVDLNGVTAGLDGKGGKKKKFGALRRMFRLND
jgi:serine/arginine repetitive matrix protein 2